MKYTVHIFYFLVIGILLYPLPLSAGEVDAEKKAAIKELLDVSGSSKVGMLHTEMMSKSMRALLKKTNPEFPEAALQVMDEELVDVFREEMETGSFYELLYPIYDAKFSIKEIKEIVAFYKTPVGQKLSKEMPAITQQAMVKGREWGEVLTPKIQVRILKRLVAGDYGKKEE